MPKASGGTKASPQDPPTGGPEADAQAGQTKSGKIERPPAIALDDFDTAATLEDTEEYVNCLWWGREGSGKTTDILTAAQFGRVLVINAEGGIKKKPLREHGIPLENIVPWPDPKSGVEIDYASMDELFWRVKAKLMEDPSYFFAVAWDSSTELYTKFVSDVRAFEVARNKRLPVAKQKEFREDPFFTDRGDYGVATEQLRTLLRKYRDLPCHFLVSALERRDIDPDTSKVAYGPAVGPAFQKDLLGYLDVTIACKATTLQNGPDDEVDVVDSFRGLTRSNGRQRAKDRLRSLPRVMADPTFERVLAYVNDELTEETDPVQKEWAAARLDDRRWQGDLTLGGPTGTKAAGEVAAEALKEGLGTEDGPVDE